MFRIGNVKLKIVKVNKKEIIENLKHFIIFLCNKFLWTYFLLTEQKENQEQENFLFIHLYFQKIFSGVEII